MRQFHCIKLANNARADQHSFLSLHYAYMNIYVVSPSYHQVVCNSGYGLELLELRNQRESTETIATITRPFRDSSLTHFLVRQV